MYTIAPTPGGYPMAPCLLTLGRQIAASARYGPFITNLGQASDQAHIAQGSDSDHNPWLFGMVRAMDLGGPLELLYELRNVINQMFGGHDPRIYPGGYTNGPDRLGTDWSNPGALHVMGGDDTGHLHISAPRDLAGCNNTNPWPLAGAAGAIDGSPQEEDEMSAQAEADVAVSKRRLEKLVELDNPAVYPLHPISEAVAGASITDADGNAAALGAVIREIQINTRAAVAKGIDLDALSDLVAAKLPEIRGATLSTADVKAATAEALRDVLGSLDAKS